MCKIFCVNPCSISSCCILNELSKSLMLSSTSSGIVGFKSDSNMSSNFFNVKTNENFIDEQREFNLRVFS